MRIPSFGLAVVLGAVVALGGACGGDAGTTVPPPTAPPPTAPPSATITVSPSDGAVEVGHTIRFSATVTDASGQRVSDPEIAWSTSDASQAWVRGDGLVTGAGPHAGDTRAERLPLLVREVARIHSIIALTLLGMVVWTWWRLRNAESEDRGRMGRVAVLLAVQGLVGYTQYFAGVPVLLVGIHVALASVVWIEIVKAAHSPGARAAAGAPLQPAGGTEMAGTRP